MALPVLILMGDKTRETASDERLSHRVKKMRGLSAAHSITLSYQNMPSVLAYATEQHGTDIITVISLMHTEMSKEEYIFQ